MNGKTYSFQEKLRRVPYIRVTKTAEGYRRQSQPMSNSFYATHTFFRCPYSEGDALGPTTNAVSGEVLSTASVLPPQSRMSIGLIMAA